MINSQPEFVGRRHERGIALQLLDSARAGTPRVLMVSGEPGIGKTRLLDWIGEQAGLLQAVVLRGGSTQAGGMPPYLPFLEALGRYIHAADEDLLRTQAGTGAPTLTSIFPELSSRLGHMPEGYPLPQEQARLRLFEAVSSFVTAISVHAPLVLLLDDVQWADGATLDLLCYIMRTQGHAHLLIVGAYRDGEVHDNPSLERTLTELTRQRRLVSLPVGALALADTLALAAHHLQGLVDPAFGEMLHNQSEGNPFFAEELLQGWREMGSLRSGEHGWSADAGVDPILPAGVTGAVEQRLGRMSGEVVEHLQTAALVGRSFALSVLADVVNQDPEAVEERLSEAIRAHLIRLTDEDVYTFSHDKIRMGLYEQVSGTRRRRLHAAIGHALENQVGRPTPHHLADLAFHFVRAGDAQRGIAYSLRAAEESLRHYAHDEALVHLRVARDLLDTGDDRYGQVLLHVGDTALSAGKEEEALQAYEAAQTALLDAGNPVEAARAAHGCGVAHSRRDALPQAHVAFEAALALFAEHQGPETVHTLVDLAGLLCINMGRQEQGEARGKQALLQAQRLGDPRLEAAASRGAGNLAVRGNHMLEGMALLERALALAVGMDDPAEAAECCACLANAAYWMAEIDRSREYTVMRQEFAHRCQQPYELRHVDSWLAFLAASQGDWDQAERLLAHAQTVVERLATIEPLGFVHQIRGYLAWEQGDYARAEHDLHAAIRIFRGQGNGTLVWYLGMLGLVELALEKRKAAEITLLELENLVAALPEGILPTAPALVCMLLMAVRMGDHDRAARYYDLANAFQGQLHWLLLDPALAEFEAFGHNWKAAQVHLERAEQSARRANMKPALERILHDQAHVKAMQRTDATGTLPAGLSKREVDVLRLVVLGMSNREIARHLYLSENTVAKHLTSIFNKTASDNRAAAAAFATRHGLAN